MIYEVTFMPPEQNIKQNLMPLYVWLLANGTEYFDSFQLQDKVEESVDCAVLSCYVGDTEAIRITPADSGDNLLVVIKTASGQTHTATVPGKSGFSGMISGACKTASGIAFKAANWYSDGMGGWTNYNYGLFVTKTNSGETAVIFYTNINPNQGYDARIYAAIPDYSDLIQPVSDTANNQYGTTKDNAVIQLVPFVIPDTGQYTPGCSLTYRTGIRDGYRTTLNGEKYLISYVVALKDV